MKKQQQNNYFYNVLFVFDGHSITSMFWPDDNVFNRRYFILVLGLTFYEIKLLYIIIKHLLFLCPIQEDNSFLPSESSVLLSDKD